MKIIFICTSFRLPGANVKVGGGEISNRALLLELAKKHQVFVISAFGNNYWGQKKSGLRLYDFSSYLNWLLIPNLLHKATCSLVLRMFSRILIKKINPDIVLCATYTVPVALKCKSHSTKTVSIGVMVRAFENVKKTSIVGRLKDFLKTALYGSYQEEVIAKADFIVSNSIYMRNIFKEKYFQLRHYVIYPPINIEQIHSDYSGEIKTVCMVSNKKEKGFDTFYRIAQALPKINFEVYGAETTLRKELQLDNLVLKGWVDSPSAFLKDVDLVLVPSTCNEAFGRIAVEALRCGKKVLVSNRGGLPETVNYEEALILDPHDPILWISKIKSMNACPEYYASIFMNVAIKSSVFCLRSQAKSFDDNLCSELAYVNKISKVDML